MDGRIFNSVLQSKRRPIEDRDTLSREAISQSMPDPACRCYPCMDPSQAQTSCKMSTTTEMASSVDTCFFKYTQACI